MTLAPEHTETDFYTRNALYIDGAWVESASRGRIEIINPFTEQKIGSVPEANITDVNAAIAGAVRAFSSGPWREASFADRGAVLGRVAEELRARADQLVNAYVHDQGGVRSFGVGSAGRAASIFDEHKRLADMMTSEPELRESGGSKTLVVREPVGPVLAIVPWNAPLILAIVKIAPALLAGCPVVVKVSPESPLVSFVLAEALHAAGVPAGMVSFLPGRRTSLGDIAARPEFRHISFTGSSESGVQIMKTAAENITRVTLELGGKSAAIILDDLDPVAGASRLFLGSLAQSGQVCGTYSRLLIPKSREQEWTQAIIDLFDSVKIGDPDDPETAFGPLITPEHRDRVEGYIQIAKDEGAVVLTGGGRPATQHSGYFVEPTLIGNVTNDMRITREEVFGPVITLQAYDDIEQAISIANDSDFGLCGGVFTDDVEQGIALARRFEAGSIGINSSGSCLTEPFGGYKKSGIGREGGIEGVEDLLEVKQIRLP